MVQVLDQETAPASIEATLNYIADTGTKIFTQTGGPGSTDVRSGGTQDPRSVAIRNGRLSVRLSIIQSGAPTHTPTAEEVRSVKLIAPGAPH